MRINFKIEGRYCANNKRFYRRKSSRNFSQYRSNSRNRDLDINDAGDIFCAKCTGSDCSASIRVTNQVYALYSILTATGALSVGFSVLISVFKLLNVLKKIEISGKTVKSKVFLVMFFSLVVIGVGFFLILFNNGSIACHRKCEPECNSE